MGKKELSILIERKIKFLILIVCPLFVFCQDVNYSIRTISNLDPTHSIENEKVLSMLNEVNKDRDLFDSDSDVIILIAEKQSKNKFDIQITKTKFEIFNKHRSNKLNKLKGYLTYEKTPVLLFGNIENSIFVDRHIKQKKLLGKRSVIDKEHPPLIYEPNYKFYELIIN